VLKQKKLRVWDAGLSDADVVKINAAALQTTKRLCDNIRDLAALKNVPLQVCKIRFCLFYFCEFA
jgi:hypothetical protein